MEMFKRWENNRNLRIHHKEKYRAMLEKYREVDAQNKKTSNPQSYVSLTSQEMRVIKAQIRRRARLEITVKFLVVTLVMIILFGSILWFLLKLF